MSCHEFSEKEIYDLIDDDAILAVSTWTEKNFDDKFTKEDKKEYLDRLKTHKSEIVESIKRISSTI